MDSLTGANVECRFLLHDTLYKESFREKHFTELAKTDLVILDVPPVSEAHLEHRLLTFVTDLLQANTPVAVIVEPGLRRRQPMKSLWVSRWNELATVPFKFFQTCSCKVGSSRLGMHFTAYIGNSLGVEMPPCNCVPTLAGATQAATTALRYFAEYFLTRVSGGNRPVDTNTRDRGCDTSLLHDRNYVSRTPACSSLSLSNAQPEVSGNSTSFGGHQTCNNIPLAETHTEHTARFSSEILVPQPQPQPTHTSQLALPTDQKERERDRKNALKEQGIEKVVKKTVKIVENHYDDCGDDLTSLSTDVPSDEYDSSLYLNSIDYDTDDELQDQAFNFELLAEGSQHVYPIDVSKVARPAPGGEPLPGRDPRAPLPKDSTCRACKHSRPRNDWEHNRIIGQCSYPYDEPVIPECHACQDRKPREHEGHTYEQGKCRWAAADIRRVHKRRNHREPAEARPPAEAEPTAGMPAQREGRELGQGGEEAAAAADRLPPVAPAPAGGQSASSSDVAAVPPPPQPHAQPAVRGADLLPRERRAWRERGDNPENINDWTTFDIGRVTRVLRTNNNAAVRLTLRKLHVRWWHASAATMVKFLDRVGVSQKVLDAIPEIVDTCSVCRTWAKPGPDHQSNCEIPDEFNKQVECDLLFVYKHIVFHLLDRCTRFHLGQEVPDKTEPVLMEAIQRIWVSLHGPPKELIVDGEGIKDRGSRIKNQG